jgi:hypothetical protein
MVARWRLVAMGSRLIIVFDQRDAAIGQPSGNATLT